jgi:hypothetical protein
LLEREQVFGAVVAHQRFDDRFRLGSHAALAQGSQLERIASSGYDGFDDGHAALAGDVTEDVMDLQIHLGQRLVHMLHVDCGVLDQAGAVAA